MIYIDLDINICYVDFSKYIISDFTIKKTKKIIFFFHLMSINFIILQFNSLIDIIYYYYP